MYIDNIYKTIFRENKDAKKLCSYFNSAR